MITKINKLLVSEKTISKNITDLKYYIYDIKRFICLSYEEYESSGFKHSLNYNIEKKDGTLANKRESDGSIREFTIEEISSYMISNMIQNARDFAEKELKKDSVTIEKNKKKQNICGKIDWN